MKKLLTAAAALAALTACAKVEEDTYGEIAGELYCANYKTCERGYYDASWDSSDECLDDYLEFYGEYEAYYKDLDCEFDLEEAERCIDALSSATCEEWYEQDYAGDCDEVWQCLF